MEWALGIGVEGRQFVARIARDGQVENVPTEALVKRGLPEPAGTCRCLATFNLSDLTPVDPREYCEATGVVLPAGAPNRHRVFEVRAGRRTFVIPSLVLMRALFQPTRHLLPMMFSPHALDHVGWMRASAENVSLVVDAQWATPSRIERFRDWVGPLSWMFAHPSARKMADSVHASAVLGSIALLPPEALCTGALQCIKAGRKLYATSATLQKLQPLDLPTVNLSGLKTVFTLDAAQGPRRETGGAVKSLAKAIPKRAEGTVELTDQEWSLIDPILDQGRVIPKESKICRRAVLDGILEKLANGTPWRASRFKAGTWVNAAFAYRTWSQRGCFAEALQVLRATRAGH